MGKRAEAVGKEAALKLLSDLETDAPVDTHMTDNLVPWLALFGGKIMLPQRTEHFDTNIWITERFLGHIFKLQQKETAWLASREN